MGFVLTEEQQFLKDSARDLLKKAPVAMIRELRDTDDANGFSTSLWQSMVEMGWPAIAISEESGGLDFGFRSLGLLLEESGKSLSASPLLSAAVGGHVLEKHGSETQKALVKSIVEQGSVVAMALQEGNFYNPENPALEAQNEDNKFVLTGTKDLVSDAHIASHCIVSAHTADGPTTFLIAMDAPGLSIEKEFMMDSRFYSRLILDGVSLDETDIIGQVGKGRKVAESATNLSNALLSAELIGLMSEAFERTVEYLKERRQFGVAIGSFQGLQHRAADLFGEIEIARSLAIKALDALDENDFMAPALCSMAKAKCIKVANKATNEGVQMFGGIGMTDDEEIGFFLKRARVAAQQFGGYSYHVDRFAKMSGY